MDRAGALSVSETAAVDADVGFSGLGAGSNANSLALESTAKAGTVHPAVQTVTLAVENMVCGGCMRKVENALAACARRDLGEGKSIGQARHRCFREPGSGRCRDAYRRA